MKGECLVTLFITIFMLSKTADCYITERYPLLMPNVRPNVPELYLCTPVKINQTESLYIIEFEPNATMNTAHHMLIYGCTEPGSAEGVWNCGEMSRASGEGEAAGPCGVGSEIIYAWARDAPNLALPNDVGFKIGADTLIKYLVLQVHYAHIDHFEDGRTDDSGVFLHYTRKPLSKLAGVFLLGTGGMIPPHSPEKMDTACTLEEDKTLHPFAYRVHTHTLGKVVAGYRIRNNEWLELGKRDPMEPQMFYPINKNISITKGDILAARCTMESNRDRWTMIGATNDDEMCNFYMMYYVEHGEPLRMKYCFTGGPPSFRWENVGLFNIPDDSSLL